MNTSTPSDSFLAIARQTLDLPEAKVVIKRSKVAGPDSEDVLSIRIAFDLTNSGPLDWHRVDVAFLIFDSIGRVIGSNMKGTFEQRIGAGKTCELEVGIERFQGVLLTTWRDQLQGRRLTEDLENIQLVVSVQAYTCEQLSLGELKVPDMANTPEPIEYGQIDGIVAAIGGMVWKSLPFEDEGGAVQIYTNIVLQNLGNRYLPSAGLVADVRDKFGLSIGNAGEADELCPGEMRLLSSLARVDDDEKTNGAIIALALRTYRLVATGMVIHRGATYDPTATRRGWGRGASSLID